MDGSIRSRTWRDSTHSLASVDQGTQTDENESKSAGHSPKRRDSTALKDSTKVVESPQKHSQLVEDEDDQDTGRRESFSDVDSDAEIQTAVPVVTRARVVEVPRRLPPALPPRNPERVISPVDTQAPSDGFDKISLNGPEGETKHEGERGLSQTATDEATDSTFHSVPVTPSDEKKSNDIPGSFQ